MKRIAVYILLALNVLFMLGIWWYPSGPGLTMTGADLLTLGRLAGLLAAFFVLLQFLLIGRAVWLERTFGLDRLTYLHHLNGFAVLVFIVLHPVLITLGYSYGLQEGIWKTFTDLLANYEDVLEALIAVLIFISIVGLSVYIVRKRLKYEMWYFIHLLTYLAIVLAWGHQLKVGGDFFKNRLFIYYWYGLYILVFGHLLFFRFVRPAFRYFRHRFVVSKVTAENNDVTSVYISGNAMSTFKVRPGQFMIFRFLDARRWWQAHPFSLSMVPDGSNIRLSAKAIGDFTSGIKDLKPGTKVLIDGPYGIFTKESMKTNKALLIAGGIGVTPIRSLLEDLVVSGKDVVLLYGCKTSGDFVFKDEFEELRRSHQFAAHYFASDEPASEDFVSGRIGIENIRALVPDFTERDIFICGPKPMMKSIIQSLKEGGVSSSLVHYEKFALG